MGQTVSSALVRQLVYEKENSEFKPIKLRLKIDLVPYPARAEGLGKYDKHMLQIFSMAIQSYWGAVNKISYPPKN